MQLSHYLLIHSYTSLHHIVQILSKLLVGLGICDLHRALQIRDLILFCLNWLMLVMAMVSPLYVYPYQMTTCTQNAKTHNDQKLQKEPQEVFHFQLMIYGWLIASELLYPKLLDKISQSLGSQSSKDSRNATQLSWSVPCGKTCSRSSKSPTNKFQLAWWVIHCCILQTHCVTNENIQFPGENRRIGNETSVTNLFGKTMNSSTKV